MSSDSKVAADGSAGDNSDETITTAVGALMIGLSVISVALRVYTRISLKTGFGWDDWFILIALSSLLVAGICVLVGTSTHADSTTQPFLVLLGMFLFIPERLLCGPS